MDILLITGGISSERTVSFKSAKEVKKALLANNYRVKVYDLKNGYSPLLEMAKKFDTIFPVLHGEEGEGGSLHKFLAKTKKPIVGTRDCRVLEKGWHKIPFKKFCDENKIINSPWRIIKSKEDIVKFGFPCVLKGSSGGSSKEVVIIKSRKDLNKNSFITLLNSNKPLFTEKYIQGTEVTVGILDNKALPILEIIPPKGQWFSYKNKYIPETQEIPHAPSVEKSLRNKICDIALDIHQKLNLGSYSRIDFIVANNIPYALEVNTIPGLTANSLFPKEAKAAGISFPEVIRTLVELSIKD
jgi:D-alanine-D-alanine ligase